MKTTFQHTQNTLQAKRSTDDHEKGRSAPAQPVFSTSSTAQLAAMEEEPLQAKQVAQLAGPEEEPLQMAGGPEEEEPLQMAGGPEEEEPLQMRPFQL